MARKPTYEELERRVNKLEKEALEHQRVEEVLRESEEKYRSFLSQLKTSQVGGMK